MTLVVDKMEEAAGGKMTEAGGVMRASGGVMRASGGVQVRWDPFWQTHL